MLHTCTLYFHFRDMVQNLYYKYTYECKLMAFHCVIGRVPLAHNHHFTRPPNEIEDALSCSKWTHAIHIEPPGAPCTMVPVRPGAARRQAPETLRLVSYLLVSIAHDFLRLHFNLSSHDKLTCPCSDIFGYQSLVCLASKAQNPSM